VTEIWVALRESEIAGFRARLEKEANDVVKKKKSNWWPAASIDSNPWRTLSMQFPRADDIVLVHDAVRPFVTTEITNEVIEAARKYGAAIAGCCVDTVKQVERTADGALVRATIPRAYRDAQTHKASATA